MPRSLIIVVLGLAVCLAPAAGQAQPFAPAEAGVCYGSTGFQGADPASLFTIDLTTGAATLVGSTGFGLVPGLAIRSDGAILALLTSKWVEVQVGATRSYAIWAVTA